MLSTPFSVRRVAVLQVSAYMQSADVSWWAGKSPLLWLSIKCCALERVQDTMTCVRRTCVTS